MRLNMKTIFDRGQQESEKHVPSSRHNEVDVLLCSVECCRSNGCRKKSAMFPKSHHFVLKGACRAKRSLNWILFAAADESFCYQCFISKGAILEKHTMWLTSVGFRPARNGRIALAVVPFSP